MRLIGLTGGIASGKSTVARLLREQDYIVLSADQIARDIVVPGQPALDDIVDTFGPSVLQPDGNLDRSRLGSLIFADPSLRAKLDAITHPRIAQAAAEKIATHEQEGHSILFYEVPLLFETGMQDFFDTIVLVSIPSSLQSLRLQERDNLSPEEAQQRIESQMSLQEKSKLATHTLDNTGDVRQLRHSLQVIMEMINSTPTG